MLYTDEAEVGSYATDVQIDWYFRGEIQSRTVMSYETAGWFLELIRGQIFVVYEQTYGIPFPSLEQLLKKKLIKKLKNQTADDIILPGDEYPPQDETRVERIMSEATKPEKPIIYIQSISVATNAADVGLRGYIERDPVFTVYMPFMLCRTLEVQLQEALDLYKKVRGHEVVPLVDIVNNLKAYHEEIHNNRNELDDLINGVEN